MVEALAGRLTRRSVPLSVCGAARLGAQRLSVSSPQQRPRALGWAAVAAVLEAPENGPAGPGARSLREPLRANGDDQPPQPRCCAAVRLKWASPTPSPAVSHPPLPHHLPDTGATHNPSELLHLLLLSLFLFVLLSPLSLSLSSAMSTDAESHLPIQSSYPAWWMYLVHPLQTQKDYQEGETDEKDSGDSSSQQQPPPASHAITITQPAPFTHHLAPTQMVILPSSTLTQPPPPSKPPTTTKDGKKQKPKRYRTREEQDEVDRSDMAKLFRRLFAEFLGTFTLVFFVAGVALEFNLTGGLIDRTAAALNQSGAGLASGLTLVFLVYSMGAISGAHFNPVVTWAFTLRGLFPPIWVPLYWAVQFAGAILAGGFLQAFYFNYAGLGTTQVNSHNQWVTGFAYEAILTFFFINVILAMAHQGRQRWRSHSDHSPPLTPAPPSPRPPSSLSPLADEGCVHCVALCV